MSPDENLIYSRRYPRAGEEWERLLAELPPTEEERAETRAAYERFKRLYFGECVYVPKPEKLRERWRLLAMARELSEQYRLDMDIKKQPNALYLDLYLEESVYPGDFVKRLGRLMAMCDKMSFSHRGEGAGGIALHLDFRTHDCYIQGKLRREF